MSVYDEDVLLEVVLRAEADSDRRPFYFCEDGIVRSLREASQPFLYLPRHEVAALSVTELRVEIRDAFRRIC